MATIQTALPWGSETRILGPRKQPGILFNLINWWLRTTGRCWASWEWLSDHCKVAVPTIKRWFRRFSPQWGLQHIQIGARRWEFVRCEVIRDSWQTDPPKEVKPTELESTRTEVSTPLQASVGVEISFDRGDPNGDLSIETVWEDGKIVSQQEIRSDSKPPSHESGDTAAEIPSSVSYSSPVERGKPGTGRQQGLIPDKRVESPHPPERNSAPLGFPEGVRQMIGICEASGKRLSRPDGQAAAATWMAKGCEPITGTVVAAYYSACRAASQPRYVPAPGPWLQMEGWTRGEQERVLPRETKSESLLDRARDILKRRRL